MDHPELKHPLTIGDLARRTGVPSATLRSWESRHGFPRPDRGAGGHRRYAETEVAAVLEMVRYRDSGLALETAVRRVTTESVQPRSIYVELRRRHPTLTAQTLTKTSLLALSRAIEDECCAQAQAPLLFGCFQRDRFLSASRARWVELARTAQAAVMFAELATPATLGSARPIEVALPRESPLNREWAVVCDAPDLPACLAAVERPGQEGVADPDRRFDAVWTVDPRAVRDAGLVAVALADAYRPGWRPTGFAIPDDDPPAASADLRRAVRPVEPDDGLPRLGQMSRAGR